MYRPLKLTGQNELREKIERNKQEATIPKDFLKRIGVGTLINEGTYGAIYNVTDNDRIVGKINKRPVSNCEDLYELRMHRKMQHNTLIFNVPQLIGDPVVHEQRCVIWMEKMLPPHGFDTLIELIPGRWHSLPSSIGDWYQWGLSDILENLLEIVGITPSVYAFNLGAWLAEMHFNRLIIPVDVEFYVATLCKNENTNELMDIDSSCDVSTTLIHVPPCNRKFTNTPCVEHDATPIKIKRLLPILSNKHDFNNKNFNYNHPCDTSCTENHLVIVDFDKVREVSNISNIRPFVQNMRELMFPPSIKDLDNILPQINDSQIIERIKLFCEAFENGYRTSSIEILGTSILADNILSER